MDVRVVEAGSEPLLEAAMRLRERVFVGEQGVPAELERDELDPGGAEEARAVHVVGLDADGEVIATGRAALRGGVAKLERVAVAPEGRGAGVGRSIVAALEEAAYRAGARRAALHAQRHVVGFYERLGWRVRGEPFEEAGIPHRAMDKPLVASDAAASAASEGGEA